VVVCHNGNEIVVDDDGAENGHDQHGGLVADGSAAAGETVPGSDECAKDHPIKIDDKLDKVLEDGEAEGDGDSDDADDRADGGSNAGGNNKAGDAKGGKARNGKAKNGKAKNGKAKGNKAKNGKPKGNKGKRDEGKADEDAGDGTGSNPGNGNGEGNGSGDGTDTGEGAGNEPGNNSGDKPGNSSGDGTGTVPGTGAGVGAGAGNGSGAEGSTPGTKPIMPPKTGTAEPVAEVLGEEATRPKPVAPGKDRVGAKNRAPIVVLPELRAQRPRVEILPAAAATRPGTVRPGATVLPQTGLGDDLGVLAGIGGTMLLVGGMTLTAGRRRSTTQI
jgi:LPXTG-motif cell wall-anchored protein